MLTSKHRVRPIGKNLLVKPELPPKKTASGIHIPDNAKNKPLIGTVLAIGDGKTESKYVGEWPPDEIGVKKGSIVIFDRFAGVELMVDDLKEEEWPRLLHIDEVRGVVE